MHLPPPGDIAFVVSGALLAGFANGLSGTGYALISLGLWLHAMSPLTAAPLVALCSVVGHIQSLPTIWHGVRWPRLWPFLVAGLLGVPIGTVLLGHIEVQPLKFGVGIVLLAYCAWMTLVRRPPVVYGGGRWADATVGFIGGLLGGMASVCGPPPAIWAQLRGWDMHEQRGVNQPFNMSTLTMGLLSAAIAGYIDRTFLIWAVMAVPSTVLAARLGLSLYGRIDGVQFRRIILVMLGLSGLSLIASGIK